MFSQNGCKSKNLFSFKQIENKSFFLAVMALCQCGHLNTNSHHALQSSWIVKIFYQVLYWNKWLPQPGWPLFTSCSAFHSRFRFGNAKVQNLFLFPNTVSNVLVLFLPYYLKLLKNNHIFLGIIYRTRLPIEENRVLTHSFFFLRYSSNPFCSLRVCAIRLAHPGISPLVENPNLSPQPPFAFLFS